MPRITSFAAPHKGLRNVLAQFSFYLGCTDFADAQELQQLIQLGDDMFVLLKDHVHTENEHTLRHLEERVPGASDHDKHDHEELESIQDALEQSMHAFTGKESAEEIHRFYIDFSIFHSRYLEHIYEEETVTELLLQQHFTDDELAQHRMAIMQRISFPVMLLWMKYTIPAQRDADSLSMLTGCKSFMPAEAFSMLMEAIREQMSAARYTRLASVLD